MQKKFYVYVHRYASGPKSGKIFYVGKGSGKRHRDTYARSKCWKIVSDQYGFTSEIFFSFVNEQCAFSFEIALIKAIGIDELVNLTRGGNGVCMPKQSTREKMRAAKIGKTPAYFLDPVKKKAAFEKLSKANSIRLFTNRGEVFSNLNDAVSFLKKAGYDSPSKGNICSCVHGNQRTAYGRTWSQCSRTIPNIDDQIHAKNNAKSKKIVRSDGVQYDSASSAAREISASKKINASQGNISMVCRGERNSAYGYGWSFK